MLRFATLLAALVHPLVSPASGQTAYTWTGGAGDWSTSGNWSPAGIPGAVDTARVTSGSPVLSADATVARFEFSGARFDGDGNLTVTDEMEWSGGDMNGRDFAETAAITVPAGATLLISGDTDKGLGGRDLFIDGTAIWEGTGNLVVQWTTTWQIRASGTLDIRNDAQITRTNGGLDLIVDGLLVKSQGTGASSFVYPFGRLDNNGAIRVETGTLQLANGAGGLQADGDGDFEVAAGATLQFTQSSYTYGSGSSVSGAGRLLVSGGVVELGRAAMTGLTQITGGALRLTDTAAASELDEVQLSGGELGGTAAKNLNGLLTWTGGTLGTQFDQTGVLNLLGGAEVSGTAAKRFGGGTYNNASTFRWLEGDLVIDTGGTFVNQTGATLSIESNAQSVRTNGGLTVRNEGLIVKTGTPGQTSLNLPFAPFTNDGEVRVEAGTLFINVSEASTDTGRYLVAEDAALRFASHTRTFAPGAVVEGAGTVRLDGPVVNRGTWRPGTSPGLLTIGSDWPEPAPEAVLDLEIGGLAPGTGHDQLAVTGTATLGGTLLVTLIDGFEPAAGDRVTLLTAASVTGAFDALELPDGLPGDIEVTDTTVVYVRSAGVSTDPAAPEAVPDALALGSPSPNPASGAVTLAYEVAEAGPVRLGVYNALGREVAVLVDEVRPAGRHEAVLDGAGLPSGVYLVRLTTGDGAAQTRRLTLLR